MARVDITDGKGEHFRQECDAVVAVSISRTDAGDACSGILVGPFKASDGLAILRVWTTMVQGDYAAMDTVIDLWRSERTADAKRRAN